jgi:hypothetical protein
MATRATTAGVGAYPKPSMILARPFYCLAGMLPRVANDDVRNISKQNSLVGSLE